MVLTCSLFSYFKKNKKNEPIECSQCVKKHDIACGFCKKEAEVFLEKVKKVGLSKIVCSDEVGASGKAFDINCKRSELNDDLIKYIQKVFDATKRFGTTRYQKNLANRSKDSCNAIESKITKLKEKVRTTPDFGVQQQIVECFRRLANHVEYEKQCEDKSLESHNGIDVKKDDGRVDIWKFFFQSVAGLCLLASCFTDGILRGNGSYKLKMKLTSANVVVEMLVAARNLRSILWRQTKPKSQLEKPIKVTGSLSFGSKAGNSKTGVKARIQGGTRFVLSAQIAYNEDELKFVNGGAPALERFVKVGSEIDALRHEIRFKGYPNVGEGGNAREEKLKKKDSTFELMKTDDLKEMIDRKISDPDLKTYLLEIADADPEEEIISKMLHIGSFYTSCAGMASAWWMSYMVEFGFGCSKWAGYFMENIWWVSLLPTVGWVSEKAAWAMRLFLLFWMNFDGCINPTGPCPYIEWELDSDSTQTSFFCKVIKWSFNIDFVGGPYGPSESEKQKDEDDIIKSPRKRIAIIKVRRQDDIKKICRQWVKDVGGKEQLFRFAVPDKAERILSAAAMCDVDAPDVIDDSVPVVDDSQPKPWTIDDSDPFADESPRKNPPRKFGGLEIKGRDEISKIVGIEAKVDRLLQLEVPEYHLLTNAAQTFYTRAYRPMTCCLKNHHGGDVQSFGSCWGDGKFKMNFNGACCKGTEGAICGGLVKDVGEEQLYRSAVPDKAERILSVAAKVDIEGRDGFSNMEIEAKVHWLLQLEVPELKLLTDAAQTFVRRTYFPITRCLKNHHGGDVQSFCSCWGDGNFRVNFFGKCCKGTEGAICDGL